MSVCLTQLLHCCRGKVLAAFLKSIGFIIPLMDAMYANYYTREVMVILVREFQTPDEEMKKIVLKVVKQCVGTDGVEPDYIRHEILPEFFRNFWVRRMALDRRNYRQLVETTVELANKVRHAYPSQSTLFVGLLLGKLARLGMCSEYVWNSIANDPCTAG